MSSVSRPSGCPEHESNFTIDHILRVAGEKYKKKQNFSFCSGKTEETGNFEWLNCTRFKPPKLPRHRRKERTRQRKDDRNPRIPFSSSQVAFLESKFLESPYLTNEDVSRLATYLKLTKTRVKIWFQNRRARQKKERADEMKISKGFATEKEYFSGVFRLAYQHQNLKRNQKLVAYSKNENAMFSSGCVDVAPLNLSEKKTSETAGLSTVTL